MTEMKIKAGVIAMLAAVSCAFGRDGGKTVVCKTCNDTGMVEMPCPVCRGTKYVWKCVQGKNKRPAWRHEGNGNDGSVDSDEGWCGYGAIYKPLHSKCKNTRKRIVCPNCASKGKTTAVGRVTVPCPDCDGQGTLVKTYYLIRNGREAENNREYIIRKLNDGQDCPYVQKRKMSREELADYRIENTKCKVFQTYEALMDFLKNGEENVGAKWYFAIRDIGNVTLYDKRRALEDMTNGDFCGYNDSNVLKRKFTDEEVKDFKSLNPNCKMFRDVNEFKDFIRKVRLAGQESADGSPAVTTDREQSPQRLSPAERKKIVDAEDAHDRDMLERKFGKEGLKLVNGSVEAVK